MIARNFGISWQTVYQYLQAVLGPTGGDAELTAGQMCSAKTGQSVPAVGFVCAAVNGNLVLRRK